MNSFVFLLFKLPFVATRNVVKLMELGEIAELATCSKKTETLIKHMKIKIKDLQIECCLYNISSVSIEYPIGSAPLDDSEGIVYCNFYVYEMTNKPREEELDEWSIGGWKVPVKKQDDTVYYTYWSDKFLGNTVISDFFSNIFNSDLHSLNIAYDTRKAVDWLNSRQKSVHSSYLTTDETTDEDLQYYMSNLKISGDVMLHINPKSEMKMSFESDQISIQQYQWITYQNLIDLKFVIFSAEKTNFTNADINRYLQFLNGGGNSKLRILQLNMQPIDWKEMTDGLNVEFVKRDEKRKYVYGKGNEEDCSFSESWNIRQDNGTVVSLFSERSEDGTHLLMLVWPDCEGNTC